MAINDIQELKKHSFKVGSNPDLVQASGGNTSWKSGKEIWVKGSGKRLRDVFANEIFACINLENLSDDEILEREDFLHLTSNSIVPSIETNFHILLSAKFVTHLHSLGSIAIGISFGGHINLKIPESMSFIPYTRPGVDLANAILKSENPSEKILVLQNHGVIFSGQNCGDIESKIELFESSVREYFDKVPASDFFPNWIEILTSGVLTPDEAVFLGEKPFIESESASSNSVAINSVGEIIFPDNFSTDRVELANFYVRVAKLIERKTPVNYLPEKEVHELLGWDKEQIRIAMSK